MQKNLKLFIAVILGIVIGVFSLIILKRTTTFTLDKSVSLQINPIEIITIIINVLLAIYVTSVLSKKNEKEKSQKELLLTYLKEFQKDFSFRTDKLLEDNDINTTQSSLHFKYLRAKIFSIISIAKETEMISENENIAILLTDKVTHIWTLFTDTPKKPDPKTNQATKLGIETLRLDKIAKIEKSCIDLDKLIYQLAIKINQK